MSGPKSLREAVPVHARFVDQQRELLARRRLMPWSAARRTASPRSRAAVGAWPGSIRLTGCAMSMPRAADPGTCTCVHTDAGTLWSDTACRGVPSNQWRTGAVHPTQRGYPLRGSSWEGAARVVRAAFARRLAGSLEGLYGAD